MKGEEKESLRLIDDNLDGLSDKHLKNKITKLETLL